jgi:formylglycine-generating enzyme required for sulfatase activity
MEFRSRRGGRRGVFRRKPVPVGRFRANAFGLHDVHGNVREWVADCYVPNYVDAPVDGAPRTDGPCTSRVLRGGSWVLLPETLRSGNRFYERPLDWNSDIGFRVARTP